MTLMLRTIAALALISVVIACGGETRSPGDSAEADVGMPMAATDAQAPDEFLVRFETSKGPFVVQAVREWSPRGVDRFHHLVQSRYFDDVRFFRVVSSFMVQFGMHGSPSVHAAWDRMEIPDDSVRQSNRRGMVSFATAGPNTRTTQLFINTINNRPLDEMGFSPIGRVIQGMDVVDSLYSGYGDGPPQGLGPVQDRIKAEGNAYLTRDFPRLDYIVTARIVTDTSGAGAARDTSAR
jgi:peptidyl-prolyl cis-trans isomerase A (cyclophilin A)